MQKNIHWGSSFLFTWKYCWLKNLFFFREKNKRSKGWYDHKNLMQESSEAPWSHRRQVVGRFNIVYYPKNPYFDFILFQNPYFDFILFLQYCGLLWQWLFQLLFLILDPFSLVIILDSHSVVHCVFCSSSFCSSFKMSKDDISLIVAHQLIQIIPLCITIFGKSVDVCPWIGAFLLFASHTISFPQ